MSRPARALGDGRTEAGLSTDTTSTAVDRQLQQRLSEAGARHDAGLDGLLAEIRGFVDGWWFEAVDGLEEPPPVLELVTDNAAHYGVWHRVGSTRGDQPGFLALHRFAIREARNVERGTEAASETWLDVRTRLEKTVERAAAGKSVPDFSGPTEIGEDNCHRYHGIQARLRVRGKWSRTKATEIYEEGRHSSDWRGAFRAAEARTYALPLHFSAWWTLLDVKTRTTRDGRTKGVGWWWKMLLHALDLEKIDALGGDRNDPTEAILRLRLRFAVSQGLAAWLRRWSVSHPYWSQVEFGLPDPDNKVAREAAEEALALVREALGAAIEAADLTDGERKALTGTLMRGENVRTSTRLVSGDDAAERQARLFALGEAVGRDAADRLGGGSGVGGSGGGGGRGHVHADPLMARLAKGMPPSPDEARILSLAVAECAHCRERWVGTVDADPYFEAATAAAPAPGRRWIGVAALGLAAALALVAVVPGLLDGGEVGLRGSEGVVPAHLDLVVRPADGGRSDRFDPARVYAVGDTVYFMVAADQHTPVSLWVEGPEGAELLAQQDAGPDRQPVARSGEGSDVVWYQVDSEGAYHFFAATDGTRSLEDCEAPGCTERIVEVGR